MASAMTSARKKTAGGNLRRQFERAPNVEPRTITGRETPDELLTHCFPAYVGRQVRRAYELMRASIERDSAVFLTMSGAMTPAGLHQSCVIPLIERGLIDCITTTGANLYHDAHRVIGHRIHEIDPTGGDLEYRLARIIRIYDLGFEEDALLETDKLFSAMLRGPEFQSRMTTPELHAKLGARLAKLERALGVRVPSLLSTAWRHGVPIFVGAVQDGSIFLNVVKLRHLLGEAFRFEVDVCEDVFEMASMQHHCLAKLRKPMAIWMLGGGVPKNYTLQGEPLLDQILGVPTRGFDIDVQFCVDPVDNGALSSCTAGEGHTWGKVSADSAARGSMYVHADVTAVFPWLTHALLSDPNMKRTASRLYDAREAAVRGLHQRVESRRTRLAETIDFPLAGRSKPGRGKTR
jgi:deoxyhypusine synthase